MGRRVTAFLAAVLSIGLLSGVVLAVGLMSDADTDGRSADTAGTGGAVSSPYADSTPAPGDKGLTATATSSPFRPEAADPHRS